MDQTLSPSSCSEDEIFIGEISEKECRVIIAKNLDVSPIDFGAYQKKQADRYKTSLQPECDQNRIEEICEKANSSPRKDHMEDDSVSTPLSSSVEKDDVLDGSMSSYLTCKTSKDLSNQTSGNLETTEMHSVRSHMDSIGSSSSGAIADASSGISSPMNASLEKSMEDLDSDQSLDMNNTAEEYRLFCKYGPEYDDPKVRRKIDEERAKGIEVDPLKLYPVDEEVLQFMKQSKEYYKEGNKEEPCHSDEVSRQSEVEDDQHSDNGVSQKELLHIPVETMAIDPCNRSSTSVLDRLQSSQVECDRNWPSTSHSVEKRYSKDLSNEQLDDSELSGVANLSSSSDKENSVDLAEAIERKKGFSESSRENKPMPPKKQVGESEGNYEGSSEHKLPTPIKCTANSNRVLLKSSSFKTPLPKSGIPKLLPAATPRLSPSPKGINRSLSFNRKPFTPITPQSLEGKPRLPYYLQNIESPIAKYIHENPVPRPLLTNEPMLRMKGKYKKVTPEPSRKREELPAEEATPDLNVIVMADEDASKAKAGSKLNFLTQTQSPRVYKHLGRQKGHLGDILTATGGKTNMPVNPSQLDNTVEVSVLQEIKK